MDDLFGTGGNEKEQRVLTRLRKDFQVSSEDWTSQDKEFGGHKIPKTGRTPSMHTMYRSLLGQMNWVQSMTQFQCCYTFSRYASMAATPTVGDVKSLNKLAKSQPVKLQYWPLTGPLGILGLDDASYGNNDDGSSQRRMTVFLVESRERSSKDGMTYESQKI